MNENIQATKMDALVISRGADSVTVYNEHDDIVFRARKLQTMAGADTNVGIASSNMVRNTDLVMITITSRKNVFAETYAFLEKHKADAACLAISKIISDTYITVEIGNAIKARYVEGKRTSWLETTAYSVSLWTPEQLQNLRMYDSLNNVSH